MEVQAGAGGHIVLAGIAVVLDAAGGIEHEHVGESHLLAVVGILHRAAVAVGERVQARAGVIVQAIDVVRRESDGQVHAAAVGRVHRRALAKLEKRRVIAVQRNTVAGQAAVDELGGGVPAVFLGVAGVLAVLVKGEGRLADVVAVQVLVGQGVEQVAGVDVFIDVHRHGVEGQGHLQQQVAGRADGACLGDAVRVGVQRHQAGGGALGHALHQHVGGGNAPLRGAAGHVAQGDGHRTLAGIVSVGRTGERVGRRGRGGRLRGSFRFGSS